jgi:hypothetical protein
VEKSCLAFRDFSSLRTHFRAAYCIRLLYAFIAHVKNAFYADVFLAYKLLLSACVIGYEERGVKTANGKIQKEQEQTEAEPHGA